MTLLSAAVNQLLVTIVLVTLAIGLPILVVLSIRFLWDRSLHLGRSKEFEKLIWQLHRIATAMEHQLNLTFPAVQPGTEEAHDLAYLQQLAPPQQSAAASQVVAPVAAASEGPSAFRAAAQSAQPASSRPNIQPAGAEPTRHGVNSMFGL